jgi:hypothetical protein
MPRYEYKLVPAPERAVKRKGMKGATAFAATLQDVMNELGAEGWHYLRADTLPQEERVGLASRTTTYRNLLVFQRALPEDPPAPAPPAPPQFSRLTFVEAAPEGPLDDPDQPSLANLFADEDDTDTPDPEGGSKP